MFVRNADCPTAVASSDEAGVIAAIDWCTGHLKDDDILSVWTYLKSDLENSSELETLVRRYQDVDHIIGRGGRTSSGPGPVLMAWPDMDDIGGLMQRRHGLRALCVISWHEDNGIRPWVTETNATVLGDGSAWEDRSPELDPIVVEALRGLTLVVNHNNTISAGFEKDQVVGVLLALRDAQVPLHSHAMQGWALANGWTGKNPEKLARYVRDINDGKRPRVRSPLGPGYIDRLRERVESDAGEGEQGASKL